MTQPAMVGVPVRMVREAAPARYLSTDPNLVHGRVGFKDAEVERVLAALAQPFPRHVLRWRVQRCGESNGRVWAIVVPYVTKDAVAERFDDVVGIGNWQAQYKPLPITQGEGIICRVGLLIPRGPEAEFGEWVWQEDGAPPTHTEPVKGLLSAAFKRAASRWGVGRYIARLGELKAIVHDGGEHYGRTKEGKSFRFDPPALPAWAIEREEPVDRGARPTVSDGGNQGDGAGDGEAELRKSSAILLPKLTGFERYEGTALGGLAVATIDHILRERGADKPNLAAHLKRVRDAKAEKIPF